MTRILVLGGNGFIGRHAVAAMPRRETTVTVGSRKSASRKDGLEQIGVRFEAMTDAANWRSIIAPYDVVLNCVGILRQRGRETYERVHHLAPAAIAAACADSGKRYVHVSALALDHPHRSRFLTSKRRGEAAIRDVGGDWIIARPSLLDGEGGFGAAWLRGVARLPVFAVPMDAQGMIAACHATEVGEALARLCTAAHDELRLDTSREFDLGGTQHYRFKDYLLGLRRDQGYGRALAIPIPGWLARIGSHLCDALHFSPFSFGHWELLRKDNVPSINRLPELLRREPQPVILMPTESDREQS